MKIICDKDLLTGDYDRRNLSISESGKHHYPSKKMFLEFLKQFRGIRGVAEIWSEVDYSTGQVKIHVELRYKPANMGDWTKTER